MISEQQIRDMEPGRELDRLVAEKVMGMDIVPDRLPQLPKYYLPEYERTIYTDVPLYSTDISAAMEMLEKFASYQCTKMHNVLAEKETKYRVIVAANKNAAYGDTLPLAACRAALIAILRGGSGE